MSLVLALGSNIGDSKENLKLAISEINKVYSVIATSQVYSSPAIEYTNQPDFLNMVIECSLPNDNPHDVLEKLMKIELVLGRKRDIDKGPRTIDIDILFFGEEKVNTSQLQIPHPRLFLRSFVVLPLSELPCFTKLQKSYTFSMSFDNSATPIGAL